MPPIRATRNTQEGIEYEVKKPHGGKDDYEWLTPDRLLPQELESFHYLSTKDAAMLAAQTRLAKFKESVSVFDSTYQDLIDAELEESRYETALELMDAFLTPLQAPSPYSIRKLVIEILETSKPGLPDLRFEQLVIELRRVQNIVVGSTNNSASDRTPWTKSKKDEAQKDEPQSWDYLLVRLEQCSKTDSSPSEQRKNKLLLFYVISVLEDDMVRKRFDLENSVLYQMLHSRLARGPASRGVPEIIQCCIRTFNRVLQTDPELILPVQTLLNQLYILSVATNLRNDMVIELPQILQDLSPTAQYSFLKSMISMSFRASVTEQLLIQLVDDATLPSIVAKQKMIRRPLSIEKFLKVYFAALPIMDDGSSYSNKSKRSRPKRCLDFYVALVALSLQSFLRSSLLAVDKEEAHVNNLAEYIGSWRALLQAETATSTNEGLPPWQTSLDVLEATYV